MRENKKRGALYGHFTPRRFARLGLVCVAPPEQKKKVRKETADEIFDFIQGRKVGGKKKHRRIAATKKTGVAVRSCHFEGDAMLDSDNNKKKTIASAIESIQWRRHSNILYSAISSHSDTGTFWAASMKSSLSLSLSLLELVGGIVHSVNGFLNEFLWRAPVGSMASHETAVNESLLATFFFVNDDIFSGPLRLYFIVRRQSIYLFFHFFLSLRERWFPCNL